MMPNASPEDRPSMARLGRPLAILSLIWSGAMFGFFFAWTCSTMWGLDAADPNVAIAAMQAMNESVRNWLFAPAFFGTPVLLALAAAAASGGQRRKAVTCFASAGLLYVVGAMLPTFLVNVPLNEGLALLYVPLDPAAARSAWQSYSSPWQDWNMVRTAAAGVVLALTGWGLVNLS